MEDLKLASAHFPNIKLFNVKSQLIRAIRESKEFWRLVLAIFGFQFILASTVGLQMMQVLDASLGNSLSIEKLRTGFDYTVFTDFVNTHGGSFSVLYGQMRWMVITYLIFGSFISTGVIYCIANNGRHLSDFFKGGVQYFFKLFLVDIIFAFTSVVVLGVSFAIVGMLFGIAPTSFDNELVFLRWTLLIAILAIILIVFLTIWKIKIKFNHIQSDSGIWSSIGRGLKLFWRDKWKDMGYTFIIFGVSILLLVLNYAAGDLPLFIMVIIIQLIALIKVFWRIVFYHVLYPATEV